MRWVELCGGAAAVSLRLLGGHRVQPPIAWMGGKRRFAGGILAALGVRREDVTSATLVDAGTWGIVWPVLLERGDEVADVLDGWRGEDPVALWDRLVAQPWPEDQVQAAAHWLWIQGRAASGVPIWWAGEEWEKARHPGQLKRQKPSQRGRWLQGERSKSGIRQTVCQKGTGGGKINGLTDPGTVADRCQVLAGWRMGTKPNGEQQVAGQTRRGSGVRRPALVADRVRHLPRLQDLEVHHIDVREYSPPKDASDCVVYFDPPYEGRTGYSVGLPRHSVLKVAQRWAEAGAVVAISEAVPLDLEGWHHLEITSLGRAGCGPEWLTMSRAPAWKPATQMQLLEVG